MATSRLSFIPLLRAVVINHLGYPDPGAVGAALNRVDASWSMLYREQLTGAESLRNVDLVVSLGSRWSPLASHRHPEISRERELLQRATDSGISTLGVCFGAQLLAANAGAQLTQLPNPRSGWDDIRIAHAGASRIVRCFFWNEFGFDAPREDGVHVLARDAACCLAYSQGHSLAVQFHIDLTPRLLERWMAEAFSGPVLARLRDEWLSREAASFAPLAALTEQLLCDFLTAGDGRP